MPHRNRRRLRSPATSRFAEVRRRQTVEIKSGFIHQVLGGQVGSRQLDDVASDQELSYAEVKALATGDDRIVRKAGLEADVARLRRQRTAHFEDQSRLQRTISRNEARRHQLTDRAAALEALVERLVDTRGDRFAMTVDGTAYRERGPAGTHVLALVDQAMHAARAGSTVERDVGDARRHRLAAALPPRQPRTRRAVHRRRRHTHHRRARRPARRSNRPGSANGSRTPSPSCPPPSTTRPPTSRPSTPKPPPPATASPPASPAKDDLDRLEAELAALTADLAADGADDDRPRRRPAAAGR